MSSTATPTLSNGQGPNKIPTAMENKNLGAVRQATPDSDAVVSSDDDHEPGAVMSMSMHSAKSMPAAHRALRRPSWLSEVHSTQRKYSFGGYSVIGAGGSQPPTPSAENGPNSSYGHGILNPVGTPGGPGGSGLNTVSSTQSWDNISNSSNINSVANSGRPGTGPSGGSSFAWNSQLWQQPHHASSQQAPSGKGLPLHAPRWSSSSASVDPLHSSSSTLPSQLQHYHLTSPTSSTHEELRSPSSTGPDHPTSATGPSTLPFEIPLEPNRKTIRSQSYSSAVGRSALARRSSRPTIYNMDNTRDDSNLYEVDEDEPASNTWGGSPLVTTITAASNPATADASLHEGGSSNAGPFSPNRATHSPSTTHRHANLSAVPGLGTMSDRQLVGSMLPRHGESTIEELDSLDAGGEELVAVGTQRAAEHAQTTLANAAAAARHNERVEASLAGRFGALNPELSPSTQVQSPNFLPGLGSNFLPASFNSQPTHVPAQSARTTNQNQLSQPLLYYSPDMPHREAIVPEDPPMPWQALYLVSFKSSRSEIFTVPEGSSLDPRPGDMVIVEGDRGQDMGIVKYARLNWDQAKLHKAEYNRRHYKSLVMFSRMFPHVAAAANSDAEFSESTDAVAASNLANPRGRGKEPDLQPKLIKRIASESEIKLLRDKEGNEAKAKRICQTKVNQHGIHMEILDAEFQLDYKKLTFYFYAEQYINFNDLVTELFKIWKLRIWLSAVNPASYPEQKSRQSRAHRMRNEANLASSASSTGFNSNENEFSDPTMAQISQPNMIHAGYTSSQQPSYGGAYNPSSPYSQNQTSGYGNAFASGSRNAFAASSENPPQTNYFGSPIPPTASPGGRLLWAGIGNYTDYRPSGQGFNAGSSSSGNYGQSLAGFAGATPFVPGRGGATGPRAPDDARNYMARDRPMSIGGMPEMTDESNDRGKGPTTRFASQPATRAQGSQWPTIGQHSSQGLNTRSNIPQNAQLPRSGPWTFGDFNPNAATQGPGGDFSVDDLSDQFGAVSFRGDNHNQQ